ncbi:MAG: tetratricopeptide repeat protein [Desulfatiglandaceae bacterium]
MGKSDDLIGQILSHGPSQGTLFLVLRKMGQEGRYSEVIQECLKALDRYPDDIRLRILLAESYFEVGSVGQAEEELEKGISMIEDLISSYKLKANIYVREKRPEEAADALKLYLAHKPQDQEALDLLEQVRPVQRDTGEVPEEPPEEEPPSEKGDEDVSSELATPTLAEIYYNQGQIHETISTYERVLLDNPDDTASMERLSELKALINEEEGPRSKDIDQLRSKKEKMIEILERWRAKAQGLNHGK